MLFQAVDVGKSESDDGKDIATRQVEGKKNAVFGIEGVPLH